MARYEEIAANPGALRGIPTGFPSLDRLTSGLQGGQLITLAGEPKAGKSSMALAMASHAHDQGYVPLLFSFEMSNEEQYTRHDALRAHINLTALLHGKITDKEKRRLRELMEEMQDLPPFILSESAGAATTVSSIAAQIERHEPDVVFIDGVYLMMDEQGEKAGSPQALTNITRSLKRLAQRRDVPIVDTTQVLTWKLNRRKGMSGDSIGYTSSFIQDSDLVLGVENTDDEQLKKFRVVLARNAPHLVFGVRYDWESGVIEELADAFDDEEDDDEDAVATNY